MEEDKKERIIKGVFGALIAAVVIWVIVSSNQRASLVNLRYEAEGAATDLRIEADNLISDIKSDIDSVNDNILWPEDHTREELAAWCRTIHTPGSLGGPYSIYDSINGSEADLKDYQDAIKDWQRRRSQLLKQYPEADEVIRSGVDDEYLLLVQINSNDGIKHPRLGEYGVGWSIPTTLARIDQQNKICGIL